MFAAATGLPPLKGSIYLMKYGTSVTVISNVGTPNLHHIMYFIVGPTQFKKEYAASKPIYLRIYSDVCLGNIVLYPSLGRPTSLCEMGNITGRDVSTVLAVII